MVDGWLAILYTSGGAAASFGGGGVVDGWQLPPPPPPPPLNSGFSKKSERSDQFKIDLSVPYDNHVNVDHLVFVPHLGCLPDSYLNALLEAIRGSNVAHFKVLGDAFWL